MESQTTARCKGMAAARLHDYFNFVALPAVFGLALRGFLMGRAAQLSAMAAAATYFALDG